MSSELTLNFDQSAIADVPHLDQWFGAWAIQPEKLNGLAELVRGMDLRSHLDAVSEGKNQHVNAMVRGGEFYNDYMIVVDGIAIACCSGPMMKHRASMSSNTSTVALRRSIRMAANDTAIRGIMVCIDSPGGTVAGTQALADELAAAAKVKPTHAFIEDLGASAAYWFASQANHVSAGPTALVGSIGTFAVVEDYSKLAESKGIKVHVVKAGENKGTGVPGTPVTDEQLAELQQLINGLNAHFLAGVSAGRKLSMAAVQKLNDGRVHLADAALDLKLIDAVETFDAAYDRLNQQTNSSRNIRMTQSITPSAADNPVDDNDKEKDDETKSGDQMPADDKKKETKAAGSPMDQRAELKRYMNAFGEADGAKYFAEGLSYTDALEAHIVAADEKIEAANKRADAAEEKLASLNLGEDEPIATGAPAKGEGQAGTGWSSFFKARDAR